MRSSRSANVYLRRLREEHRALLRRYWFGRSDLLPIRYDDELVGNYLASYLPKFEAVCAVYKDRPFKGRRARKSRVTWPVAPQQFSWHSEVNSNWRQAGGRVANACVPLNPDQLTEVQGPRWAYRFRNFRDVVGDGSDRI